MSKTAFISIKGASKYYGDIAAVVDADLDIQAGEFFGLLGSSGSGKSTLLRMIGGFEDISEGTITIDGQPMAGVPPHHRPTNMVFQSYAIFPHLNVFQNVGYGLRKERLSKAELARRINDVLDLVKLSGFGDRRASQMSGGQRQRVALARALVKRPKVLLLDEPMGALDKRLREHMQVELRALQRSLGIAFLFVTHDQEEALTMCDRIAVMSEGRILEVGTPKQLYERPEAHFTAQFLGEMNFFDTRVLETNASGGVVDVQGLGEVAVNHEKLSRLQDTNGHAGIRPENLRLLRPETESDGSSSSGVVVGQVYLGNRTTVLVRLNGIEQPVLVSAQHQGTDQFEDVREGDDVAIGWRADSILTFSR